MRSMRSETEQSTDMLSHLLAELMCLNGQIHKKNVSKCGA